MLSSLICFEIISLQKQKNAYCFFFFADVSFLGKAVLGPLKKWWREKKVKLYRFEIVSHSHTHKFRARLYMIFTCHEWGRSCPSHSTYKKRKKGKKRRKIKKDETFCFALAFHPYAFNSSIINSGFYLAVLLAWRNQMKCNEQSNESRANEKNEQQQKKKKKCANCQRQNAKWKWRRTDSKWSIIFGCSCISNKIPAWSRSVYIVAYTSSSAGFLGTIL